MNWESGLIGSVGGPVERHVAADIIYVMVDDTHLAYFDVLRILLIEPELEAMNFQAIKTDGLANPV